MAKKSSQKDSVVVKEGQVSVQKGLSPYNHVTLFSNGIGHFKRHYVITAGKKEKICIPFRCDAVSDVLASLAVSGNIRYDSLPSFTPTNSNATSLNIDPQNAMRGLLQNLHGANITVKAVRGADRSGALLGTESITTTDNNGSSIREIDFLVFFSNGGVSKIAMTDVLSVHFEDEAVRAEVEKAVKNAFSEIKPDSTFLELCLSGLNESGMHDVDEVAVVQYTAPVAAWKMRYNIKQEKDSTWLEGTAIIDNNTDETWDNFIISVVTGNPISFSTDLAEVKVPRRTHLNLVDNQVHGNVEVSEGVKPALALMRAAKAPMAATLASYNSTANVANNYGFEAACAVDLKSAAVTPEVEAKDVGDFCVFTSKEPLTIASKRSAVVTMFSVPLNKAGSVLLYKEKDHARRPWRAIKFKNETDYSLGRGKVVIYQDGVFAGECVMEAAKPGENRMLPHCLENGVKVAHTSKPQKQKISAMRLGAGIFYSENVSTAVSVYEVENRKDEEFKLLIEHVNALADPIYNFEGVGVVETEKLSNGVRVYFPLKPKEKGWLTVTETYVNETNYAIGGQFHWLQGTLKNHPLASHKGMKVAADIQKQIDDLDCQIKDHKVRKAELTEQACRVRSNLQAVKNDSSEVMSGWVTDLDASEKEIREIDKNLVPNLQKEQNKLAKKLEDHIKTLTLSWKE